MLLCYLLAGVAALFGSIAIASTSVTINTARHHSGRLADKTAELARAYHRIDALEQMLDESRAAILNVPAPQPKDARPGPAPLPPEVIAELDEIEDPAVRAEMAADIRVELEQNPEADPLEIARKMIGG